ncbi:hypothetical protein JCM33374_g5608 [Metschnikowia sp. JCM 33374]|nr:hypothetical protein JCM33374_g5608 [Metschnikowia sp. JCM 33374]
MKIFPFATCLAVAVSMAVESADFTNPSIVDGRDTLLQGGTVDRFQGGQETWKRDITHENDVCDQYLRITVASPEHVRWISKQPSYIECMRVRDAKEAREAEERRKAKQVE